MKRKNLKFVLILNGLLTMTAVILPQSGQAQSSLAKISGCNSRQTATVRAVDIELQSRLDEVTVSLPQFNLDYVYEKFILVKNRQWSEGSQQNQNYRVYLNRMLSVFRAMQKASHAGIRYQCVGSFNALCLGGETPAYVKTGVAVGARTIYLCEGFFAQTASALETALHELSHYTSDTDDLGGSWLQRYNTDVRLAAADAFHIQSFSAGDIANNLRTKIWSSNWPKN